MLLAARECARSDLVRARECSTRVLGELLTRVEERTRICSKMILRIVVVLLFAVLVQHARAEDNKEKEDPLSHGVLL